MSVRELIFLTLANHLPRAKKFDRFRTRLLAWAGMVVAKDCEIWGPLTIRPIGGASNIVIGARTFLNTETRFGVPIDKVVIGNDVQIGPRVMFETISHGLVFEEGQGRSTTSRPIHVEDQVWIGAGAIITQGVTVGKGAVVAAGAVVTRDVPPHTVVGGVPAKVLRTTR